MTSPVSEMMRLPFSNIHSYAIRSYTHALIRHTLLHSCTHALIHSYTPTPYIPTLLHYQGNLLLNTCRESSDHGPWNRYYTVAYSM
jgi:hypothetical protein